MIFDIVAQLIKALVINLQVMSLRSLLQTTILEVMIHVS